MVDYLGSRSENTEHVNSILLVCTSGLYSSVWIPLSEIPVEFNKELGAPVENGDTSLIPVKQLQRSN